ncbi:MAG: flavin reductase family protein [Chloroflexi bacterium]|nr:flavin reductase family protein [Chloroflexota bacterium]
MRIKVDTGAFGEYLHYGAPLTLVTVHGEDGTVNLSTNVSITPLPGAVPRLAMGILHVNYTNKLIKERGEFVVNVLTDQMRSAAIVCGNTSGADVDKLALTELTLLPGTYVQTPLIAECPLNIECRVESVHHLPDLDLWVAEILAVYADEAWANDRAGINLKRYRPLMYAFGHTFTFGKQIGFGGL